MSTPRIRVSLLAIVLMGELPPGAMAAPQSPAPHKPSTEEVAAGLPDFAGRLLTLTVLDPAGTTKTYPGKEVRVRLSGPLSPQDMVMIVYPGGALANRFGEVSGANSGLITIPSEHIGPFKMSTLGKLGKNKMVSSNDVILFIDPAAKSPPATVTNIRVEPSTVELTGRGATEALSVIAEYSDGIERHVSDDGLGTTYEGSSPSWLFGPNGLVVGKAAGSGYITVANGGHSVRVSVTVEDGSPINNAPHAFAGESYTTCDSQLVRLDASKSYDVDEGLGDVLTYEWDLDGDGEFDDAFGDTPQVQLIFPGPFWMLSLRVRDSEGLESIDYAFVEADPGCAEKR
jgi:hypothetical protein